MIFKKIIVFLVSKDFTGGSVLTCSMSNCAITHAYRQTKRSRKRFKKRKTVGKNLRKYSVSQQLLSGHTSTKRTYLASNRNIPQTGVPSQKMMKFRSNSYKLVRSSEHRLWANFIEISNRAPKGLISTG